MTLSKWLEEKGLSQSVFGKKIGKSRATINRYCTGLSRPTPKTILKIIKETQGKVLPESFQ